TQSVTSSNFPPLSAENSSYFSLQECPIVNRSALGAKVSYQGSFNAAPDRDGINRRLPVVLTFAPELMKKYVSEEDIEFLNEDWTHGATFFPSLSLQSVLAYLDRVDKDEARP